MAIKIAMIEDHVELLDSMTEFFGNTGEFEIIQRALSVEKFLQQAQRAGKEPDVILLDLMLPNMSGIDGIPLIREMYPDAHILVHSVLDDSTSIFTALKRGASGYIAKGTSLENISSALRNAYHGMSVMSQEIASKVLDYFKGGEDITEKLSKKELEVAEALKIGMSYKMIAIDSGVTIDAIRFHVRNIYRKLSINSKGELINLMMRSTNKRS
jgi:DNA-binding NarL/FixJ family response regulator